MPAHISVLIVNWRSKDFLRSCLLSLRSTCADIVSEIIVVDAGSFDGCEVMLAQDFPEVIFRQSFENVGFGLSNNFGSKWVTGETLLLLNPDTELIAGSVQILLNELLSLPKAGIVSPRRFEHRWLASRKVA